MNFRITFNRIDSKRDVEPLIIDAWTSQELVSRISYYATTVAGHEVIATISGAAGFIADRTGCVGRFTVDLVETEVVR
ncbi:hypothetical protein [Marinitenerispora sediminis]|uniref:Uncharacterized protein n=1 Tax=Marinitenerispora sediminis TaxID=1931232 RepID=A0A368T6H8_9ACTN|nr:hypothetical protein [Marinitenerispora sediminis]RCV51180.1 hypothetical protein DEF23_20870 [Marinitenerispora sediminis]RCV59339.1 hypothetical protein DEF24_10235 [Marinitenerispora sediminis]